MMNDIKEYVPYENLADLREYNLPILVFKSLWGIQDMLYKMEQQKDYFLKNQPQEWKDAQKLKKKYQKVLLQFGKKDNSIKNI